MSPPVPFPRRAPRGRFGTEPPPSQRIALVSGANRGLGLEVSRQLAAAGMTVLLGARNLAAGEKAAKALGREGGDVHGSRGRHQRPPPAAAVCVALS